MDRKEKKFVNSIAKEVIENVHKTYEQSGRTGTILRYKKKEYLRIGMFLSEINAETYKQNIAVSIEDQQLKTNEVRAYYIDTRKEKLQGG